MPEIKNKKTKQQLNLQPSNCIHYLQSSSVTVETAGQTAPRPGLIFFSQQYLQTVLGSAAFKKDSNAS